jgi:DNA polymerase III subunit gamma/tau
VEQVRFAPQAGKYKVYIVDEVHMLSSSAFNAFLKTLEEPPPFAIFILATTEKHKILPTILSRCQIFDFKRITNNDTVEHLQEICDKEEIKAEKAALHIIAQKSEGCMRDSLSILDKIVSFTNGQLTYSNTLEHLNILDEDYYFKFLDFMQQQDMSSAMLLYDEINRKGFEGDTVIEGFAEFIRNLLVSKDAKAAILLEVAEDFKQKYLQASQKINAGWLIGALNLLNEAEINYKQARNKRLLVELTIIKLSYLQQAVELVNNDGVVSKKKVVDTAKPVAFRAVPMIKIPDSGFEISDSLKTKQATAIQKPPEARLTIEVPETSNPKSQISNSKPETTNLKSEISNLKSENPKLQTVGISSLEKIRQKVAQQNQGNNNVVKDLTQEELYVAWGAFIEILIGKKNHSAVTNFKMATLNVIDNNSVEIVTENNIQQKFIEQERAALVDHLQKHFCNKQLIYNVILVENENSNQPVERTLSGKEQYLKIIEEYPLVKELKDRLRLELDY